MNAGCLARRQTVVQDLGEQRVAEPGRVGGAGPQYAALLSFCDAFWHQR